MYIMFDKVKTYDYGDAIIDYFEKLYKKTFLDGGDKVIYTFKQDK